MSGGGGGGEKTEKATPERIRKARQDGSIAKSQDLPAWIVVATGAVMLPMVVPTVFDGVRDLFRQLPAVAQNPEPDVAVAMLGQGLGLIIPSLQMLLIAVVLAAIVANVVQGGLFFKKFKPRFQQFNVPKGLMRLFGKQALWNGAKALLKTAIIGAVLYTTIIGILPYVQTSGRLSIPGLLTEVSGRVTQLLILGIAAGIIMALFDVVVTMRRNRKHTRMSKQELKDEAKKQEGDPHVKAQRRSIQMSMSRNRMMAAVPDADVVVVNPTHVAVALKYEQGKGAPRVVAKGKGAIAQKIRDLATEHKVPIVQDVMLARTLEKSVKVGAEIPEEFFESVARVLAFVWALRKRGAVAGFHRAPGAGPVPEE